MSKANYLSLFSCSCYCLAALTIISKKDWQDWNCGCDFADCQTVDRLAIKPNLSFQKWNSNETTSWLWIATKNESKKRVARDKKFEYGLVWDGTHRYCKRSLESLRDSERGKPVWEKYGFKDWATNDDFKRPRGSAVYQRRLVHTPKGAVYQGRLIHTPNRKYNDSQITNKLICNFKKSEYIQFATSCIETSCRFPATKSSPPTRKK